ncbi:deoxyribose-phosphate aldolase [Flavobacterium sp. DG1-102-2]|uniref:deoxyribose-phosphate aldolase n=1 Tax=Flavobacterium sp. DG1-102-2 TaxID=3081663 RepID=UPI002949962B|nr:deoxyribose-phosphate aldolase [Flavobacterium sp. DG1-102-2]MDV6170277.1 deoxyribose-phosphate aldolase [Flavobacterium sp. DG1-102-2]
MDIKQYLDSTYLKTADQAGLSEADNLGIVKASIVEAIEEGYKLIMIRPEMVAVAKEMIAGASSKVTIGTVIDFPLGQGATEVKLAEAQQAILDGADDLDFVLDYEGFKAGKTDAVREQVLVCTKLGLENNKIVKWIVEIAALNDHEIVQLSALVKNVVLSNFDESTYNHVFVKSSTGFYKTRDGIPNGATLSGIKLMLENSYPLPVKAAGGVRTLEEAQQMISLGVKRIGTSSAAAIVKGFKASGGY